MFELEPTPDAGVLPPSMCSMWPLSLIHAGFAVTTKVPLFDQERLFDRLLDGFTVKVTPSGSRVPSP